MNKIYVCQCSCIDQNVRAGQRKKYQQAARKRDEGFENNTGNTM